MLASNDQFRNGLPERLPDGFTLTKTTGDPSHHALRRVSWSIVGRWTAGAGDAPSPSETDEITNVGA